MTINSQHTDTEVDDEFTARDAAEAKAEADERLYRSYQQRISSLEYGIDGTLTMLDDLAERADEFDEDLARSIRGTREFLDGYYRKQ
jgi:hypothetical protein